MRRAFSAFLLLGFSIAAISFASAQGMGGMDMKGMDKKGMETKGHKKHVNTHKGAGTVTSVDAKKGTVSIAHEPIQSMKWPAMTMAFTAKDKKMLDAVKPGDKVQFEFVQEGSKHRITSIK